MMIPHRMLSPEALCGVLEAVVTREGTDDGAQEGLPCKFLSRSDHFHASWCSLGA
jgi:uncharacterized protein YheU (UPF0270 family)